LSLDQYSNSFANTFTFYGQMNNSTPQPSNEASESEMMQPKTSNGNDALTVACGAPDLPIFDAASGNTLHDIYIAACRKFNDENPIDPFSNKERPAIYARRDEYALQAVAGAATAPLLTENKALKARVKDLQKFSNDDAEAIRAFENTVLHRNGEILRQQRKVADLEAVAKQLAD
jgi:hypothetical protein